jgi:hypothetical protein
MAGKLQIYADEELGIAAKTCRAVGLAEAEGTKDAKNNREWTRINAKKKTHTKAQRGTEVKACPEQASGASKG